MKKKDKITIASGFTTLDHEMRKRWVCDLYKLHSELYGKVNLAAIAMGVRPKTNVSTVSKILKEEGLIPGSVKSAASVDVPSKMNSKEVDKLIRAMTELVETGRTGRLKKLADLVRD